MTPEEKSLLERTHKLAEDNNTILRSIRRMNRIAGMFRIFYWVIVIAAAFGAYYLIQPYVDTLFGAYNDVFKVLR